MSRIRLIGRLVRRDLRRRPGPAVLLVLAITSATATLTLGLVLHGVTNQPYQQTRAETKGPDVVAQLLGFSLGTPGTGGPPPHGPVTQAQIAAQIGGLIREPGVTGHSGPYPVASAVLRYRGIIAPVEAEGRAETPASIDQPKLTAGTWVRPGGIVLERTFADALGAGVGDRVTLDGRSYQVAGIAVTAASQPYPNMCFGAGGDCVFDLQDSQIPANANDGLAWVTEPGARSMGSSQAPLSYFVNLKLKNPATAPAFAGKYSTNLNAPALIPWQDLRTGSGLLVQDEQQVLSPGALLAGLLAIASVAVLTGGRMAELTRRVGLLKAIGATPGTVGIVLLAENLVLALISAVAGLVTGWLAAPLVASPGAALVGSAGAPSVTVQIALEVVAVALIVALAATLVPAIRGARTSTVSALADAARSPRRHGTLIRLSRRLPVALLFGMRLIARRPRRAVLSAASVAVTATGIVAVLAFHTTVHLHSTGLAGGLGNPVVSRDEQMLTILTAVLVALAVLNAVCAAWATVLDARQTSALARALGASPGQVTAGIAAAQALPAVPGVLLGIPLGVGLFAAASQGAGVVTPPAIWLAGAVLGTLAAVAVLAAIPARIGARRPVFPVLQSETA